MIVNRDLVLPLKRKRSTFSANLKTPPSAAAEQPGLMYQVNVQGMGGLIPFYQRWRQTSRDLEPAHDRMACALSGSLCSQKQTTSSSPICFILQFIKASKEFSKLSSKYDNFDEVGLVKAHQF